MTDNICVTGAAGFIGFHVCRKLLNDGFHVTGIDNINDYYPQQLKHDRLAQLRTFDNFSFHQVDIADEKALDKLWHDHGGFTKVIHLAAQAGVRYSLDNPMAYIESNVKGHTLLLEKCRHQDGFKHFVYASSSSVYGRNDAPLCAVTDRVDKPASLYAATKRSGELITESYAYLFGIQATGLRFFTVYGPWGRPDMAPAIFAHAIRTGKTLPVFNHGKLIRDFTFIDDIVDGILRAFNRTPDQNDPHKIYNLGNNKGEQLMDFIAAFESALGKKAQVAFKEMQAGDVLKTCADIDISQRDLGYNPTTPIANGIPQYVAWYIDYYGDKNPQEP